MSMIGKLLQKLVTAIHVQILRLTGFRVGARFQGLPVLVLTTVGAQSGKKRSLPLLYYEDGERYVLIASNGGRSSHPGWFHNLRAKPRAKVRMREGAFNADARVATEEERANLWPAIIAANPQYARYQEKTDRHIPLVILTEHREGV